MSARRQKTFVLRQNQAFEPQDLISFSFYLEQLSNAGVPLCRIAGRSAEQPRARLFREMTTTLIEDVEAGKTFSEAISEFPGFQPDFRQPDSGRRGQWRDEPGIE